MPKAIAFRNWPKNLGPTYGPYRATLDHWKDADTGVFLIDVGFGLEILVEIRLLAYSSPESHTEAGKAATTFANILCPPGSRVRLHTHKNKMTPTITRWVAAIELEDGSIYGVTLKEAGHAREGAFEG